MKETIYTLNKFFAIAELSNAERAALVRNLSDEELSSLANEVKDFVAQCSSKSQLMIDKITRRKPSAVKAVEAGMKPKGGRRVGS